MALTKKAILDGIFAATPSVGSEEEVAENVVIPFLLRLGYEAPDIRRKVTIQGTGGTTFRKQADIVVCVGGRPGLVVETKRITRLERFGFSGLKTPLGLAGAGGDVVGSVYETFLTGTLRGDLGQYLTPRQIIEFMVDIADIRPGERVLDLACGSGGFLIRAFQRVRKELRSAALDPDEKKELEHRLVHNDLWGIEINPRLATLCRINLILHGDGYEHVYTADSIRERHFENTEGRRIDLEAIERGEQPKFDVILMNPPFNLAYEDAAVLNRYELGRGNTAQGSDYLMLERALRVLKEDTGRLLIVMPHGVASGLSERAIRDFIKRHARVKGCTSLPVGTFKSFGGSNARTAILHLEKGAADGKKRFLAQAEFVGYDIASKYYREIERNDLPAIVDGYDELRAQLA